MSDCGRTPRGRSPLEIAAFADALLRACRLRPCKRVTRSINPLEAARAVNNVGAAVCSDPVDADDRVTRR